jgi:hypothetical protein
VLYDPFRPRTSICWWRRCADRMTKKQRSSETRGKLQFVETRIWWGVCAIYPNRPNFGRGSCYFFLFPRDRGLHHAWDMWNSFATHGKQGVGAYISGSWKGVSLWPLLFTEASRNHFFGRIFDFNVCDSKCSITCG